MDKTIRNDNKWAKISGKRGRWTIAKGYKSNMKASFTVSVDNKELALIIAQGWIND